jgi:hypothetical protein
LLCGQHRRSKLTNVNVSVITSGRAPERQSKRRNRARRYAAALDGSGIVGGTIHTEDEYAELNSIVPARPPPLLLTRMMIDLSVKK